MNRCHSAPQPCRICRSDATDGRYLVKEMMFGSREEFSYFRCGECGCLQIESIPDDLGRHYPPDYYSFADARDDPPSKSWLRAALDRLRVAPDLFGESNALNRMACDLVDPTPEFNLVFPILKHCPLRGWGTRFLDVGCGAHSWWLKALERVGFRHLTGVDPHIEGDSHKRRIAMRKGEIADVTGAFDVITLHHSLEHIADQVDTLRAARALLAPGGTCVVRVPLVSSLVWETYGTDWVELDAPRHLYLHTPRSIEIVAEKAGLSLAETVWDSTAFEFYGSEQYRRGISLMSAGSYSRNPAGSDFTYREMAEFTKLAERANREARGGRGCFFLRAA